MSFSVYLVSLRLSVCTIECIDRGIWEKVGGDILIGKAGGYAVTSVYMLVEMFQIMVWSLSSQITHGNKAVG